MRGIEPASGEFTALAEAVGLHLALALSAAEFTTPDSPRPPRFRFGTVVPTGPLDKPMTEEEFADMFAPEIVNGFVEQISKDMGSNLQISFSELADPPGASISITHHVGEIPIRVVPFYDAAHDREFVRLDVYYG